MSEKFLAKGRHEGYCALPIGANQKECFDKVSSKEEYDQTVGGTSLHYKKVNELYHLNKVAFEDLILSADHKSKTRRIIFQLIKTCKTNEYPESNWY